MEVIPQSVLSAAIRLYARWRRQKGQYTHRTLQLFETAEKISGNARSCMDRIGFQRDLGMSAHMAELKIIGERFEELTFRQQLLFLNFRLENDPQAELQQHASSRELTAFASRSPAIADYCRRQGWELDDAARLIAEINRQDLWRDEFRLWLKQRQFDLGIVGNSAGLETSSAGEHIDLHQAVARFNHYPELAQNTGLTGSKTHIWVQSPGYRQLPNEVKPDVPWLVVTGPDARFLLSDWSRFVPIVRKGVKILTIPLGCWQPLVGQLHAPPSAGVLFASWMGYLAPELSGKIALYGFRSRSGEKSSQHMNKHNKTSGRHNWPAESQLINQLEVQGYLVSGSS